MGGRGAASDTNPLRFGGYCKHYGDSTLLECSRKKNRETPPQFWENPEG